MIKKHLKTLLAVVIFGACIALVWLAKTPLELYREKPLPAFALRTLGGENITTADWQTGKPIVLNFFASWCSPCREEMPELALLNKEIPVYGIAMQDSPDQLTKMFEKTGNPFTAVGIDGGAMAQHLEVYALPTTLVLDSLGQVSYVHQGPIAKGEAESKLIPLVKHLY